MLLIVFCTILGFVSILRVEKRLVFLHSKQCQLNNFGPKNLKTFELRTQRSINKNKVSWQNAFICYFFMWIRSPNLLSFFHRSSRTAVLGQIYSGKPKIIPRTPSAKRESLFGFALLSLYVLRSDTCIRLTLACFHLLSIFGFNFFCFVLISLPTDTPSWFSFEEFAAFL